MSPRSRRQVESHASSIGAAQRLHLQGALVVARRRFEGEQIGGTARGTHVVVDRLVDIAGCRGMAK